MNDDELKAAAKRRAAYHRGDRGAYTERQDEYYADRELLADAMCDRIAADEAERAERESKAATIDKLRQLLSSESHRGQMVVLPDNPPHDACKKLVGYVLTVSMNNTDEWMDGLVDCINEWCESVNESDRVKRKRRNLAIVRGVEVKP
jgi:hypothetical protein